MEEWCRSGSLLATEVDLDGDGMNELFLDGSVNFWFSGSNGFSTFLFRIVDARYQLVQDFFGSAVIVLQKTSNGHLDLVQACTPCDSDSGTDAMSYVTYRWNGENYEVISRHRTKEM
jgi:hypothetical protein